MINLFQIASNDQSIVYLGQVFGFVGNVLPVTSASMVLGVMFKTFNAIVLTIAVLIVVYVTVVGVVKTAHEGEMMGKGWSSLWLPIRMVIGIAALVPTPSGYSSIQIIMMWIIVQGIGAADVIWTTVLNYTQVMGSPLSTVTIPSVAIGNNIQSLFQGLVCQESARQTYPNPSQTSTDGGYYCTSNGSAPFCQLSDDNNGILNISGSQTSTTTATTTTLINGVEVTQIVSAEKYLIGPSGACGSMTYCDTDKACSTDQTVLSNQIACNACTTQKTTLQATVNVLGALASAFVTADHDYRKFVIANANPPSWVQSYCTANNIPSANCCLSLFPFPIPAFLMQAAKVCGITFNMNAGDSNNAATDTVDLIIWPYVLKASISGDSNFLQTATNNYVGSITSIVQSTIQQAVSNATITDTTLQEAQSTGWIFAGAYYYYLAKSNDKNVDAAIPIFTVTQNNPISDPIGNILYGTRNNYDVAGKLVSYITSGGSLSNVSIPSQMQDLSKLSSGLASSAGSIMDAFMSITTGGSTTTNPLASLQTLGYTLLIIAQALFAVTIVLVFTIALLGNLNIFVLGTGFDDSVGPTLETLGIIFAPFFALFMGALFTFGASLAVYVPLIPYVIFTMGAVAWFLLVIEAMVAAPLVALGILSPSQQGHEILGKSEPALMLLFGIFLRPGLMIFGMIAAMLLSSVVVAMISVGFKGVMGQIISHPGLVEIMLFLGAYVSLCLAALNKCFSLIHVIPDQTLRWISGHHGGTEGGAAAQEGTGKVEAGVGGVAGQAQGVGEGMKKEGAGAGKSMGGAMQRGRERQLASSEKGEDNRQETLTPKGGKEGGDGGDKSGGGKGGDKGGGDREKAKSKAVHWAGGKKEKKE